MTSDFEPHPHRSPNTRPVRVARFDALSPVDGNLDDGQLDDGQLDDGQLDDGQLDDGQLDDGHLGDGHLGDGHLGDEANDQRAEVDTLGDGGRSSTPAAALGGLAAGDAPSTRVAGFAGLGGADRPSTQVAGFDGLDGASAPPAPVAPLDALGGPQRTAPAGRPVTGPDRRPDTRPPATDRPDGVRLDAPPRSAAQTGTAADPTAANPVAANPDAADLTASEPDDIPPDRPLPRGRRRGARTGRLGPDAPDPGTLEREADPVAVAREICLRLLTDRARTRQELAQALARKGVSDDAAAAVLDRFDEVGLIDDAAFAGQWVRSRHSHRGLGRRAIAVELRRKGVADDVAGEALAEVDAESEDRRARELVDRKLRSIPVDTAEQRVTAGRRLVGMLARKGYGAGTAYRVVREALAERGAEIDELNAEPGTDG